MCSFYFGCFGGEKKRSFVIVRLLAQGARSLFLLSLAKRKKRGGLKHLVGCFWSFIPQFRCFCRIVDF